MGQAKQRGTLEQRQTEGIARRKAEEQRIRDEEAAREAAMTPHQRAERRRARRIVRGMLGYAAGVVTPADAVAAILTGGECELDESA